MIWNLVQETMKEHSKDTVKDRYETWDPDTTYVIGHQRPDTDAIGSALGYAWFLQQTGVEKVKAIRAGQPVEQTRFALERFGLTPPRLLTGVAPTFGHVARSQVTVAPDAPLSEAVMHLAAGVRVVPVVDEENQCHGIITPLALARAASRFGFRRRQSFPAAVSRRGGERLCVPRAGPSERPPRRPAAQRRGRFHRRGRR